MKQLKRLTRKQKIILDKYLKKNKINLKVQDMGLVTNNKVSFTVACVENKKEQYLIYY